MHANLRKKLVARFSTPDVPKKAVLLLQGCFYYCACHFNLFFTPTKKVESKKLDITPTMRLCFDKKAIFITCLGATKQDFMELSMLVMGNLFSLCLAFLLHMLFGWERFVSGEIHFSSFPNFSLSL